MAVPFSELEANFSNATAAIHVDDRFAGLDLAPALHPSTTFRHSYDPEDLEPRPVMSVSLLTEYT
jgi:cystathionine gamma-synthase